MTTPGNLNQIFGPAAATKPASDLTGRLPRVSGPGAAVAPVAPPVAAPLASPVAHAPTSQDTSTRQISVYVLPHVPNAIRAAKAGRTNAAVVYDAIERCHAKLPALLAARRAASPSPESGSGVPLFARQAADARVDPQRVPWTFKATPANRAVLDQLVTTHRAVSRSELVSTALEATYPAPTTG